ncbi:hypothetical protein OIU76_002668 [Salix suchowensis]|nr:hypothetical protein OIU76_002668 [Salix suchowensis]
MGFDPMTHRPRTDIFSSLPHLIALANLKELMDHHSLEEHALRMQTEAAQMAKLQYLQYLLQPQPPAASSNATSSNNLNNITSSLQGVNDLISFSHLPDLQIPCNYQTPANKEVLDQAPDQLTVFSQGENSPNSPWQLPSSSTPSPPSVFPPVTQNCGMIHNLGDASSTSSYAGEAPSVWHDILENPLFNDIA